MPRIDPLQLLNCLTVLLSPNGGILSKNEVQRLANLMTKFSKKLVSKCVYVLILKNTERSLLGQFMVEGGWNLVNVWMQDGINNQNWDLVKELLELLLISPTDVEQLKTNNLPKLVKSLSKHEDAHQIGELANSLVNNWLKIVKDDQTKVIDQQAIAQSDTALHPVIKLEIKQDAKEELKSDNFSEEKVPKSELEVKSESTELQKNETPAQEDAKSTEEVKTDDSEKKEEKRDKSNHDRHKRSSKSSRSSKDKDKEREKDKHRDKSRVKERRGSSSSSSSKDRSSSSRKSSSDKHRSNGSLKSKSKDREKDHKDSKETQMEKDKDTLAKLQPQTLQKLGRIPKKSSQDSKKTDDSKKSEDSKKSDDSKKTDDSKKLSFSIEVRKTEEKPKTVKIFNAKMRSTGLLEEAKPPPPRPVKKSPQPLPVIPPLKRPSPPRETIPPPEKKSRIEPVERPGSIKLIPPKPKPAVLLESDIFMDALTASAPKKEPKKRKRRTSVTKDAPGSPPPSPTTPSTPPTSSLITPANFYQDTLETESAENKTEEPVCEEKMEEEQPPTPTDDENKMDVDENRDPKALKGCLSHGKKKGPKRSIRWKPDCDLVEVQYFELDETERINVYKTFIEMSKIEMSGEREALQLSRNRPTPMDDNMEPKTHWRPMMEIDMKPPLVDYGCKSLEKDIQFAREKTTISLPPRIRLQDTPGEPDPEVHPMTDPVPIPLDDPENTDTSDAPPQAWPEPKGSPPHVPNVPQMFTNIPQPQYQNFPPQQFPAPPFQQGFIPPNMQGIPGNNMNMNMNMNMNPINNGPIMPNIPPDMMNQGPPMFGPKDNFNQNEFNQPFNNQNMGGMYPQQNNFNMRGRGGFRRGMGNSPWIRMNGPGHGGWNQRGGGMNRGGPPGRMCKNVRNHGYCRNRDNCPFIHPN